MDVNTPIPTNYGGIFDQYKDQWLKQIAILKEKFGKDLEEVLLPRDYPTDVPILFFNKDKIKEMISYLKSDPEFQYDFLVDITATDEETDPRFHVVYQLTSYRDMCRIRVKAKVRENEEIPSIVDLWPGANWAEREVWDMFGIRFSGHPDLRRILMDERWVGHPLRKDYPLRGYQIFPTAEPVNLKLLED